MKNYKEMVDEILNDVSAIAAIGLELNSMIKNHGVMSKGNLFEEAESTIDDAISGIKQMKDLVDAFVERNCEPNTTNVNLESDWSLVPWASACQDQEVWLRGTCQGKFRAYGPHKVVDPVLWILASGTPTIKGAHFKHCIDELLIPRNGTAPKSEVYLQCKQEKVPELHVLEDVSNWMLLVYFNHPSYKIFDIDPSVLKSIRTGTWQQQDGYPLEVMEFHNWVGIRDSAEKTHVRMARYIRKRLAKIGIIEFSILSSAKIEAKGE